LIHTGDHRYWLVLPFFAACLSAVGADPEVKAGGIVLTLPAPANDFADAGDKLRTTFFELLVPSNNRLLSAYVPAKTRMEASGGKMPPGLDAYAMVEVSRQAEYTDCTPQAFEQVLKSVEPSMGKLDAKKIGELEQELNIHLKSLSKRPIQVGHPEMLGAIFHKSNAAGFAMLMAVKEDDRSDTMAGGIALLRVKQRLIFAYLYRKYESPDTVSWLGKNLEA
jgi:hypothetical protein